MRKVAVVAAREYKSAVRTKSFLVSVLVMPMLMFGGAALQVYVDRRADTTDKVIAVVDRTPDQRIFKSLAATAQKRNGSSDVIDPGSHRQIRPRFKLEAVPASADDPAAVDEQRLTLSDQVRQGTYWGFVDIGPDAARVPQPWEKSLERDRRRDLIYETNHPTYEEFPRWLQIQLVKAITSEMTGRSLAEEIQTQQSALELRRRGLTKRGPDGHIQEADAVHLIAQFVIPAALVALMFMLILLNATPAMHGVVEEKMQRIAEVLLGSISPFRLMLGKLLGLIGVSLTVAAVYLGGAYWAAWYWEFTEFLPAHLLAWFLVFQVLAVLMYGSLFLAVGAAVTDTKESQTLVMPIILVVCLPMFVLRQALEDPNGPLVAAASFFPPVTPMMMVARLAIPPGPAWWQPLLAVALSLVMTLFCVWAAGRIFRVGMLVQGKGARPGQIARWVFRG